MNWRDPRAPAPFLALVVLTFVAARFVGVAVHEVLGHGLFAVALGGSFYGVYMSPVTGFAMLYLPVARPAADHAAIALAGIFADLVAGILVFRFYPRIRTFLGRLSALALLESFLVYTFAYVATGAWAMEGGDPGQAVVILGAPHLTAAFTVVGTLWAAAVGFAISREVLVLVGPEPAPYRQIGYLVLFWFGPLPLGALPNVASLASASTVMYLLLLGIVAGAVVLAARHLARGAGLPALARPVGRFAPVAVAFLLVLPTWAFFGPTGGTATNLLIADPPLEAEHLYPAALNVRANLSLGGNVLLEFRTKIVPDPGLSPLERRAIATYDDRADLPYWSAFSAYLAVGMFTAIRWNVTAASIDPAGTVWSGTTLPKPRVIDLAVASPGDVPRLTNVTVRGNRTFVTLTVHDPFRANRLPDACDTCFLDEVNLSWAPGYLYQGWTTSFGIPVVLRGFDATTGTNFVRFRNTVADGAPAFYQIVLERP